MGVHVPEFDIRPRPGSAPAVERSNFWPNGARRLAQVVGFVVILGALPATMMFGQAFFGNWMVFAVGLELLALLTNMLWYADSPSTGVTARLLLAGGILLYGVSTTGEQLSDTNPTWYGARGVLLILTELAVLGAIALWNTHPVAAHRLMQATLAGVVLVVAGNQLADIINAPAWATLSAWYVPYQWLGLVTTLGFLAPILLWYMRPAVARTCLRVCLAAAVGVIVFPYIGANVQWSWLIVLTGVAAVSGLLLWNTQPRLARIALGIAALIVAGAVLYGILFLLYFLGSARNF